MLDSPHSMLCGLFTYLAIGERRMFCDAHCDTATLKYRISEGKKKYEPSQLDFEMLRNFAPAYQAFAFFMDPDDFSRRDLTLYNAAMDFWDKQLGSEGICKCCSIDDFENVREINSVGAFYTLEGMDFFDFYDEYDEDIVYNLSKRGVKFASLTWNHANSLASGVETQGTSEDVGLTAFGVNVVKSLNKYKIIPDVSHSSVKTFYDICNVSETPIIATHSNAFELCRNERNLNDDQLKLIGEKKGFVGINLYPPFLNDCGVASVDDVVKHVEYIMNIVGEDSVGLGCDFDGVEVLPQHISCMSDLVLLKEHFFGQGWCENEVERLFGVNLYDFLIKNAF